MKLTSAEETYLLAIHRLSKGEKVSTNMLAQEIGIAAASVTDMIQKLAEKEYVRYEKYKGVSLLPTGTRVAKQISQTKKLWRQFLEEMKLPGDEIDVLLDQLQHVQSQHFRQQFQSYLLSDHHKPQHVEPASEQPVNPPLPNHLFPEPIQVKPTRDIQQAHLEQQPKRMVTVKRSAQLHSTIADFQPGAQIVITGMTNYQSSVQPLLTFLALPLGAVVTIKEIVDFDQSVLIEWKGNTQVISPQLAKLIIAVQPS